MKNIKESQAFPSDVDINEIGTANFGLSKREYFAGLAMQGILSNQTAINALTDITSDTSREDSGKKLSKVALLFADALLLELSKERE